MVRREIPVKGYPQDCVFDSRLGHFFFFQMFWNCQSFLQMLLHSRRTSKKVDAPISRNLTPFLRVDIWTTPLTQLGNAVKN
jgi:hypothetical protein